MSNVSTIPPQLCFVTTLADGLWRRAQGDPLRLASMVVYVPTRRAARHLREAFLRVTGAKAALLPRMKPLGDVDEVDLDFAGSEALDGVPPAIAPLRRQMLLTRAIRARDGSMPLDQAAALAVALGSFLDQVQTEGRDFADLQKLAPENLAKHWQETLTFLEIITRAWPDILASEGCVDPATRRNAMIEAQAAQWQSAPPDFPVIAAGSTGSVPVVGRFMQTIAGLPQGEVILPGLDLHLDASAWEAMEETHPQFMMKRWLGGAKLERKEVRLWDGCEQEQAPRVRLMQESMRPAKVTQDWRLLTQEQIPATAFAKLSCLACDHHREEADVIALRLRSVLEEDGKTAALVTPDRLLAARVAASLGRWGITANDSAGTPLTTWPLGSFLGLVLAASMPSASPVDFLALLKHPLAATGLDVATCRRLTRRAEMRIWRGVRVGGGWSGAAQALADKEPELASWLSQIAARFAPLTQDWYQEKPLGQWIDAHIQLAENLAASIDKMGADQSGAARLWRGEAGEAAVNWLDEWRGAIADFPPLTGAAYRGLFDVMCAAVSVRPAFGQHPRLSILGPLEARLLHHDVIILGGLNEGTWPPAAALDPWLSRPMKSDFGLPLPERRVGQSAHDFVQLASGGEVLLTRSKRVGGSPTVPSRFWLALETVLRAAGHHQGEEDILPPAEPWRDWARLLDEASGARARMEKPSPCPPLAARPTQLSVTEISTWRRNPYAIYAKRILKLRKLDDIDADVTAAEHGTAIHAALENFTRATQKEWPAEPLALLIDEGRKAFAAFADRPQIMAFWWPQFERIAAWFVGNEAMRRANGIVPLGIESEGLITVGGGALTLKGRADRIDLLPDGRIAIIDYKTGYAPTKKEVLAGYEPQLPLLALMARLGAFKEVGRRESGELSYWRVHDKDNSKKFVTFTDDLEAQMEKAREGLKELCRTFADPATPYQAVPKPDAAPRYDDYAHLARLAEWAREKEGGG